MICFPKHGLDTTNEKAAGLLAGVQKKYNAEVPAALEAYMNLANLIGQSSLTGPQAQIIQLAISLENGWDFCKMAHTVMSKMNKTSSQTLDAILNKTEIENDQDRAMVNFALTINRKRGWLEDFDLQEFFDAGFAHQQVFGSHPVHYD